MGSDARSFVNVKTGESQFALYHRGTPFILQSSPPDRLTPAVGKPVLFNAFCHDWLPENSTICRDSAHASARRVVHIIEKKSQPRILYSARTPLPTWSIRIGFPIKFSVVSRSRPITAAIFSALCPGELIGSAWLARDPLEVSAVDAKAISKITARIPAAGLTASSPANDKMRAGITLQYITQVHTLLIVRSLVAHGADIQARDNKGFTALDYSRRCFNPLAGQIARAIKGRH